ncbi:MAG: ricin-type beta-trefoil lectin domain protein [Lewinellaceae bacterium]|nr:ricin-type beta-trefoil lectin domain protein [Lewinellaceae bacterium]
MKKQPFNFRSLLLLSFVAMLTFGFFTPQAMATTPVSLLKGQLPIPGSSEMAGFLPTSLHGVLLENQGVQLVWEQDGNLNLRFYNREILWSSNTGGKGDVLYFQQSDGKLLIKDKSNNVVWSAGITGGQKLEVQANRNLVLLNSSNQRIWESGTTINTLQTDGLRRIGATGKPQDFMVPLNTSYQYITIYTEGADGGKKQVKEASGATRFTVKAGSGATIVGIYEIGTGENQIPPGSFLRVFVGKKGYTRTGQTTSGCDGGGGTGVLLKRYNEPEWRLLQVAGGGGGAYSDCCTDKHEGKSAETGRDGGKADGSNSGNGGTNGGDGGATGSTGSTPAEPGRGAFCSSTYYGMWPGGKSDPTILPGNVDNNYSFGHEGIDDGEFGFGIGGDGGTAGGGGGGYSGGGAGASYHAGGGGGSYLNTEQMAIHNIVKIKHGATSDTQDGYILYQFSNSVPDQEIKFAYNTNKCIDDDHSSTTNGTNIQSYSCNGTNAQKWFFQFEDRTIRSMVDISKCLSLKDDTGDNGTNIHLWDCKVNSNQTWVYNGIQKTIHSGLNGNKCMDAANGSAYPNSNVNVQLWDCQYTNDNQKWEIAGATTVSNPANMKHIVPVLATGFAVHSHTGAESGSNIQLWTKDNINTAEQWYFDGLAIKMRDYQNLCIDLSHNNTDNGNNIQLYNCKCPEIGSDRMTRTIARQ